MAYTRLMGKIREIERKIERERAVKVAVIL